MTRRISGPFEVKLTPQAPAEGFGDPSVGRMAIDKAYSGDLEATGKGEMLATQTAVPGSAGYVALERVSGTLCGRAGSFSIQHAGIMNRGAPTLSITVVPDSGTDELAGLSGTMAIRMEGKAHFYDFEFTFPDGD
ncbi:hypothetical protein OJF2_39700 [Aquisphaera giovannonii]|uniref:DUF3224 domain-containing protein n=1 Tax=Aquisphaera giovannonii TaxID=406548 RepID=A0A5B9W4A2_9BACT|nr:DUF3224 domain-containing protein [Aquisphaera giovannonii]QEH35418.1 hypothetical protein OJF2_39700 [Aquisphaera giovannonii]